MRKCIISLIVTLILMLATLALAETVIKAEVDNTRITTEDTLTYKITISSSEQNLPVPVLPKLEGFVLLSQAQTSEISLGKGSPKSFVVYVFILAPTASGKFKIGPATIKVKDKTYATQEFEIEVIQGKIKPPQEGQPSPPEEPRPEEGTTEPQYTI